MVKFELDSFRINNYSKIFEDVCPGENNRWRDTKRLLGETNLIPPLEFNHCLALTDREKCEAPHAWKEDSRHKPQLLQEIPRSKII